MDQPTLFDTSTPAPELVQQWWGVRLRNGQVAGPFKTRGGAIEAQAHYAETRGYNGAESRIVTCRTTAWEDA